MSTSNILLDQSLNTNYVDILVFEPCGLFFAVAAWGGIEHMVRKFFLGLKSMHVRSFSFLYLIS